MWLVGETSMKRSVTIALAVCSTFVDVCAFCVRLCREARIHDFLHRSMRPTIVWGVEVVVVDLSRCRWIEFGGSHDSVESKINGVMIIVKLRNFLRKLLKSFDKK